MYGRMLTLLSFFIIVTSLLYAPTANAMPHMEIDADTAYNMITSSLYPNLVILDVRTRSEFDTGHIRNAILIPYTELQQRMGELAEHKNHEIIVYCACGARSGIAANILDANGFTKVYDMFVGITTWIGKGYPVTTSYMTQIFFNLRPNPANIGQSIFLKGILTDQFSSPIANQTVKLYYRGGSSSWRCASALNTNAYGVFVAAGQLQEAGVYEVCIYYPRCTTYEASYTLAILVISGPSCMHYL